MTRRVSESARNRVIARLQRGYASGALGTETLERSLDAALTVDAPRALRQTIGNLALPSAFDRLVSRIHRPAGIRSSGLLSGIARERPAVLGRSHACDLVLTDHSVSRRHAMVVHRGDRIILTDLESTNGTFVNGREVMQAEVRPGDRLRLGDVDLLL